MSKNGRDALTDEIWKAINHVVTEFEMEYGEIIGILDSIKIEVALTGHKLKDKDNDDV